MRGSRGEREGEGEGGEYLVEVLDDDHYSSLLPPHSRSNSNNNNNNEGGGGGGANAKVRKVM